MVKARIYRIDLIITHQVGRRACRVLAVSTGEAIEQPEAREQRRFRRIGIPRPTERLDQEGGLSMMSPRKASMVQALNNRTGLIVMHQVGQRVRRVLAASTGEAIEQPRACEQKRSRHIGILRPT